MFAIFLSLLLAAALHDLGHVICAWSLRVKVRKWCVFYIMREPGTDMQNLLITLAGPVTSLVLGGAVLLCPWLGIVAIDFGLANFAIGFINLLPMRGTDGARIASLLNKAKNLDIPTA